MKSASFFSPDWLMQVVADWWTSSHCLFWLQQESNRNGFCFREQGAVCGSENTEYLCGFLSVHGHLTSFYLGLRLMDSILFSGIAGFGRRWDSLGLILFSQYYPVVIYAVCSPCPLLFSMLKVTSLSFWVHLKGQKYLPFRSFLLPASPHFVLK